MTHQFPALIIAVPLLASLLTVPLGALNRRFCHPWLVFVTGLTLCLSLGVAAHVITSGPMAYNMGGWEPPWGIAYRIDQLNALMLVLISGTAFLGALYSGPSFAKELPGRQTYASALYLLMITSLLGIVITGDLFNIFVFLEISSLSAYGLIASGSPEAPFATFRGRTSENLGTITVLHDITALKQMDQMKSDFVSMVSHEVRSPMNSLLMQLKIILDGLAGDVTDKQKEILQRASEKILNLNNLVSELLDLSKIESGLIAHEKEQVDISKLLTEQYTFHSPYAAEKNIDMHLDLAEDLPLLFANRWNMEEVFANLITNAIKYSPEDSSISVTASLENDYMKIEVSDTGFGIGEEYLEQIFTRFFRVKDEKSRTIQGTGLGLSIVKSIIESHHGKISVKSTPGKGTTFTVLLPLQ